MSTIAFRRVGGRVIPIHSSENKAKEIGKAAGLVGLGLGAAGVAGHLAGGLMEEAAGTENVARTLGKIMREYKATDQTTKAVRAGKLALRHAVKARSLEQAAFRVRGSGVALGAALIGAGVHKALSQTSLKDNKKTKAGIAGASAVGAAFVLRSSYLRRVGNRGFSVLRQAARRAFLKV